MLEYFNLFSVEKQSPPLPEVYVYFCVLLVQHHANDSSALSMFRHGSAIADSILSTASHYVEAQSAQGLKSSELFQPVYFANITHN